MGGKNIGKPFYLKYNKENGLNFYQAVPSSVSSGTQIESSEANLEAILSYKPFLTSANVCSVSKKEDAGILINFDAACYESGSQLWKNQGTLTSVNGISVDNLKYHSLQGGYFYFDNIIKEVNYNIGPRTNPELSIEVFFRVHSRPNNRGWIVGHDNGGYDRALLVHDHRFGGFASAAGYHYHSKNRYYPKIGEWTHMVGTYKNDNSRAPSQCPNSWRYQCRNDLRCPCKNDILAVPRSERWKRFDLKHCRTSCRINMGSEGPHCHKKIPCTSGTKSMTCMNGVCQYFTARNGEGLKKFSIGGLKRWRRHSIDADIAVVR